MAIVPRCHITAPKAAPQERTPSKFGFSFVSFVVKNGFREQKPAWGRLIEYIISKTMLQIWETLFISLTHETEPHHS